MGEMVKGAVLFPGTDRILPRGHLAYWAPNASPPVPHTGLL